MIPLPSAPSLAAPSGCGARARARSGRRAASARGWAWLLAWLLALQGFAWVTHAASHTVPSAACAVSAAVDHGGDAHCSGGACVTCHALSMFDGAPPADAPGPAQAGPVPIPPVARVLTPPRRALPWAQSRAPPVPA